MIVQESDVKVIRQVWAYQNRQQNEVYRPNNRRKNHGLLNTFSEQYKVNNTIIDKK